MYWFASRYVSLGAKERKLVNGYTAVLQPNCAVICWQDSVGTANTFQQVLILQCCSTSLLFAQMTPKFIEHTCRAAVITQLSCLHRPAWGSLQASQAIPLTGGPLPHSILASDAGRELALVVGSGHFRTVRQRGSACDTLRRRRGADSSHRSDAAGPLASGRKRRRVTVPCA